MAAKCTNPARLSASLPGSAAVGHPTRVQSALVL